MSVQAEQNEARLEAERERRVREAVCALSNAEYVRYGLAVQAHLAATRSRRRSA